jgi:hypothetical protein
MLSKLKKNHRYTFYEKLPNSDEIKKFRAVLISISNKTLLVHSYESDDQLNYSYSKHCVWSMPCNWIVNVEVDEEDVDVVIDHDDIFTELIVLD